MCIVKLLCMLENKNEILKNYLSNNEPVIRWERIGQERIERNII